MGNLSESSSLARRPGALAVFCWRLFDESECLLIYCRGPPESADRLPVRFCASIV